MWAFSGPVVGILEGPERELPLLPAHPDSPFRHSAGAAEASIEAISMKGHGSVSCVVSPANIIARIGAGGSFGSGNRKGAG
jgi:hypothetical protein